MGDSPHSEITVWIRSPGFKSAGLTSSSVMDAPTLTSPTLAVNITSEKIPHAFRNVNVELEGFHLASQVIFINKFANPFWKFKFGEHLPFKEDTIQTNRCDLPKVGQQQIHEGERDGASSGALGKSIVDMFLSDGNLDLHGYTFERWSGASLPPQSFATIPRG
jgi:hypothetical protein